MGRLSCLPRGIAAFLAVLAIAGRAGAQDAESAPAAAAGSLEGPRLVYTRGPAECLSEESFRREVAIAGDDGADHFRADGPAVVRVWFEKVPGGAYRGTIEYSDAGGQKEAPSAQTYYNCEILGRFVGGSVASLYMPKKVPAPAAVAPAPPPLAPPPAAATPVEATPCPVCGTSPPAPVPPAPPSWRMDLTVGLNAYAMMTASLTANVGPAVGIAGEVRGEIFGITMEFRAALPSRAYALERIPGATSSYPVEFDLSQLSVLVAPCARYKYVVGCVVGQFGVFLMQSSVEAREAAVYGLGPRIGFEIPFAERFSVFGFGEVMLAPSKVIMNFDLPRPNDPDGPVANTRWVQPVASAFFGAGLSVKFK